MQKPSGAVESRGRFVVLVLRLKWLIVQTVTAVALIAFVLWASVFLYGAFYYVYVPVKAHEWPLHLRFRTDCDTDNRLCSFPMSNISLMTSSEKSVLVHGQAYVVSVEIEMPESSVNRNLGMFLVQVQFYAKHGDVVFTSSRSSILQYRSFIQRTFDTIVFLPFSILRTSSPTQVITTELTDNYLENPYRPAVGVVVEVHNKKVEIYNMSLKIHARFSGLRYLLYYWPIISAIFGISSNFFFLSIVVFFSWLTFVTRSSDDLHRKPDSQNSDKNEDLLKQENADGLSVKDSSKTSKEHFHKHLNSVDKFSSSAVDGFVLKDKKQLTDSVRKRKS